MDHAEVPLGALLADIFRMHVLRSEHPLAVPVRPEGLAPWPASLINARQTSSATVGASSGQRTQPTEIVQTVRTNNYDASLWERLHPSAIEITSTPSSIPLCTSRW